LDQFCCQLDLTCQQLPALLSRAILHGSDDEFSAEVEDRGDIGAQLHQKGNELEVFGDLIDAHILSGEGEELSQLIVDLLGKLVLLSCLLLALLLLCLLMAVDHCKF
jgi:hypothetical protein